MATPILSHSISQFQLSRYASIASQLESLKAEHSQLQQQIIAALGSGASVEAGARSASLKACERRSVAWKDVVIRLRSAGYASRILSCTKPTSYYKVLVR